VIPEGLRAGRGTKWGRGEQNKQTVDILLSSAVSPASTCDED